MNKSKAWTAKRLRRRNVYHPRLDVSIISEAVLGLRSCSDPPCEKLVAVAMLHRFLFQS